MEEIILCAAIHYDDKIIHIGQPNNIKTGYVICGFRHNNIKDTFYDLFSETQYSDVKNSITEGFLTSKNNFVNRKNAYWIAKERNQIRNYMNEDDKYENLISEDLY